MVCHGGCTYQLSNMFDDPLGYVLKLVLNSRYNTRTYLNNLIINPYLNDYQYESDKLKHTIRSSNSSRRIVYCNTINPNLNVHQIYSTKHAIFEAHRIFFTRFHVSSHSLAVETAKVEP